MDVALTPVVNVILATIIVFAICGFFFFKAIKVSYQRYRSGYLELSIGIGLAILVVICLASPIGLSLAKVLPYSHWIMTLENFNTAFKEAYSDVKMPEENNAWHRNLLEEITDGKPIILFVDQKPQQCYFVEDANKSVPKVSIHYDLYCGEGNKISSTKD